MKFLFENPLLRFAFGIVLITLLDSVGAIASNKFNIRYVQLALVSLAIYIFTGFILGKVTSYQETALYTALLGLFDGTIGLKLCIYFNANMGLDEERLQQMQGIQMSLMMIVVGLIFGTIGFALA